MLHVWLLDKYGYPCLPRTSATARLVPLTAGAAHTANAVAAALTVVAAAAGATTTEMAAVINNAAVASLLKLWCCQ